MRARHPLPRARPTQSLMQFQNVSILGLAHVDAPHRTTSEEICERLGPTLSRMGMGSDLLESASGITARRFWDVGFQPSDAATLAAEKCLAEVGLDRRRVDVLISTSVCRDYVEPSVACLVHGNLGLPASCLNFDVGNACLAFLTGMQIAGNMIERGQIEHALIVDGEGAREAVEATIARLLRPQTTPQDLRDQFATLTLGSGGVAMLLARRDLAPNGHRFIGAVERSATQHRGLCRGQVDGMYTDGKALLANGILLARETWGFAQRSLGWQADTLDDIVLHQVSASHTTQLLETLGLEPEKALAIYPEFGNIGPASVPIVLSKSREAGRLEKGMRVGLLGIGSGLNCCMAEIVW